jgi:hypothetical protein
MQAEVLAGRFAAVVLLEEEQPNIALQLAAGRLLLERQP